ncbi:ATP-dependent RNA helicase DEAH11, chloroplastic-like protein, partial [Tanacetum coccineum]
GPSLHPDVMKKVVEKFGPDLHGLKERFPGSDFSLNTRYHTISIRGSQELKQNVEANCTKKSVKHLDPGRPFACGACSVETCTRCHLENYPFLSCEEFKLDSDLSLKEWMKKMGATILLSAGAGYVSAGHIPI